MTNKINEMSKNSNFNKSSKKINFISEKFSNLTLNYVILKNLSNKELREILDNQKKINSSKSITLILSVNSDKVIIIAGVTKDLLSDISSVDIVNVISIETGGKGGGGRPDMAQAGGTDSSKIEKALDVLKSKLQNKSFN